MNEQHTPQDDPEVLQIREAYHKANEAADNLKVGDSFMGAMPAAEALYEKNSLQYHIFITMFIHRIRRWDIYVNGPENTITRLVKP